MPMLDEGTLFKVLLNWGSYYPGPGILTNSLCMGSAPVLTPIDLEGPSLPIIFFYSYCPGPGRSFLNLSKESSLDAVVNLLIVNL